MRKLKKEGVVKMPGNHGSSNRELVALPGHEEKETAESERTESSHFILVRFFGFGVGFLFVWLGLFVYINRIN